MSEAAPHVARALARCEKKGVNASFRGIPKCLLSGSDRLCLDDYMHIFQMVETESGKFKFSDLYRNYLFRLAPGCEKCIHFKLCQGFHAAYGELFGVDEFKPVIEGGPA